MSHIKLGLTQLSPCSYLASQQQQLAVALSQEHLAHYSQLIRHGFRRSGNTLYRPHCSHCQACESLRVNSQTFKPSKSQKRILKKAQSLHLRWSDSVSEADIALYKTYISSRHRDGDMYPPKTNDLANMFHSQQCQSKLMQVYCGEQLLAGLICDFVDDGLSAVYSYYDTRYSACSLGKLLILKLIESAKAMQKPWVYLGYQIDACDKMNYKAAYSPHQRYQLQQWRDN